MPRKLFARFVLLAVSSVAFALPAHANLVINSTFDSSITSDSNAVEIEAVINTAVQTFESLYSNNITVSIYFQEGGGLGTSNTLIYDENYAAFYNLYAAADANPAALAALNANGGDALTNGGINPVTGGTDIEIKSANARAIGSNIAPGCIVTNTGNGDQNGNLPNECASSGPGQAVDGIISLNTSITNPPNSPASDYWDLLSTAEHEIDEVLGLGSALENCQPGQPNQPAACTSNATLNAANDTPFGSGAPQDLFRWSAATGGSRVLGTNCTTPTSAYFAYGPDTGEIAQFNNACNGGDFADWQSDPFPDGVSAQVQDAFSPQGVAPAYGTSEIDAMTAIGYTSAVPEPASMVLFAAGVGLLAFLRRRDWSLR